MLLMPIPRKMHPRLYKLSTPKYGKKQQYTSHFSFLNKNQNKQGFTKSI